MSDVFVGTLGGDSETRLEVSIYGLTGDDFLVGTSSEVFSHIYGGDGNDLLGYVGSAFAHIYGEDGNDFLQGGGQNDLLSGGDGLDTFSFAVALGPTNIDRVLDFEPGIDKIGLFSPVFPAIGSSLSRGEFYDGGKAHDKSDRIIYNDHNGKLFYDDDGNGADPKVLFALLEKHLDLSHHDFEVILP